MPRQSATTKATGGGGFTFADKVAAGFLAQMLKRAFPLEREFGPIVELHFETRDTGQVLDDLLLVLKHGNETTRCAVSVKSNRQLSNAGFNREFVEDAWEQWRAIPGKYFDPAADLLGLIVGAIDDRTRQAWHELQKQAADTTPDRLVRRLANAGQASNTQRKFFKSLRTPINGVIANSLDTARLVAKLRVLYFSDEKEKQYVSVCAEIVHDGIQAEAARLWDRLLTLAAENRPTGGYFDVPKLVRALRGDFELKDYPDFEADWTRLAFITAENLDSVRTVLGSDIRLERSSETIKLKTQIHRHPITAVVGESGSGKSALISQLVAPGKVFKRTLWLNANQLSRTSQAELALGFNLRHSIPELIAHLTLRGCVLVLDGFEQFEGDARRRALELLKALSEEGFVGWSVIITCQPQSRSSMKEALIEANIPAELLGDEVELENPTWQEIFDAVENLPAIRTIMLRSDLHSILRNLVILDWVLRAEVAQRFSTATQPWIGETELIACIWERWMGETSMRFARDTLLRNLAQREGEKLSGAVHVDTIAPDQLGLLGALADDGLIRVKGPSVQFSHDLMGDWARFRVLVFSGEEVARRIKEVAQVPRWGRAIRLYAQSLAEKGQGLDQWKTLTAQLVGDEPEERLARDLFLDGLLFAANSATLLELVWPDLISDKGQILDRLLKRMLHVASMPDWRFQFVVEAKDIEQSESWFRIPYPIYWYPALTVLNRHSSDVAANSFQQGAEVCALWLRTMPEGMPGRREAGLLALTLAKEAQARTAAYGHYGEHDRPVYEALLYAAREFPDEVTQIALELSARKDEPDHAVQRRVQVRNEEVRLREKWRKKHPEQSRRKLPPPSSFSDGPIRAAFPDGPLRRVSEGFRSAVLDMAALDVLATARPDVAREILLAVCIDEPKPWNPYNASHGLMDAFGLAHWQRGYPPIYWKGPFFRFLQVASRQGLDAIVRLVNHATARWLEAAAGVNPDEKERKRYGLEFEFNGKSSQWIGNCAVYGWHRHIPLPGDLVACALMALEKWLYDELDKGHSVRSSLEYVCEQSESLAFAGVLISVGLKHPKLFARELQPLLGNIDLYWCQRDWSFGEQQNTDLFGWATQGPKIVKLAYDWERMPHRRCLLWNVATSLMLQDPETMAYLIGRKAEWAKLFKDPTQEVQFFLARFDPENYKRTSLPDGTVRIAMRWPAHLEAIANQSRNELDFKALSMALAVHARQYLSGAATLDLEQVPAFATQVKRLATWVPTGEELLEQHRIDSVAGGIAVLVVLHRSWLSQNPDIETWCIDTLRELQLPEKSELDSPGSVVDHAAEAFLGEAGVALLVETDEDWVVRLALGGVTGFYYLSTFQVMCRAYFLRQQLGDKFHALVNALVLWSALRQGATRESRYLASRPSLAKYREALFRRYRAGRLKSPNISLRKVEVFGHRLVERISRRLESSGERRTREAQRRWAREHRDARKLYREHPDIDLEILRRGFGFLTAMVRTSLPADEKKGHHYFRELFNLEMRTFPKAQAGDDNYEIEGTPYPFDDWMMQRVAEFVARIPSAELAKGFYAPILELGPAGRYWVEDFLQAWIVVGLQTTQDTVTFVMVWRDMVQFTTTLPEWSPGEGNYWSRAESLAVDLMGLHKDAASVLGQGEYKNTVATMIPVFEQWAKRWLKFGSVAAWFAHFLPTESGQILLPLGIKELANAVGSFQDRDWHHHGLGALLTEVLSACWKQMRHDVESNLELRRAFLGILTELCARQIPEALHLRSRVAEALRI